jgi:capsular polysaccharide biosynthesis protein
MLFEFAQDSSPSAPLISSASVSVRRLPVNLVADDFHFFSSSVNYEAPTSFLKTIDGVKILPNGWMYKNATLLKDGFVNKRYPRLPRRIKAFVRNYTRLLSAQKMQDALWFTDTWSHNYFHWLTDAIPRLHASLAMKRKPDILLPQDFRRLTFVAPSLAPFELGHVVFLNEDRATSVGRLSLPEYIADTGNYNEPMMRDISDIYRNHFGVKRPRGRRVYISRNKAQVRRVANEDELQLVLARHGFEIVHCEAMSFSQQVELFSDCSVIAGPHGAGQTNMLFMPPQSAVVEIQPKDSTINTCFFSLASAMKHHYFYVMADPMRKDRPSHLDDMIVDCSKVDSVLSMLR